MTDAVISAADEQHGISDAERSRRVTREDMPIPASSEQPQKPSAVEQRPAQRLAVSARCGVEEPIVRRVDRADDR